MSFRTEQVIPRYARRPVWLVTVFTVAVLGLADQETHGQTAAPEKPPADIVTYQDHVQPVLRKHCVTCHSADKSTSDLNVMAYAALMTGGASGEAVSPGKPDQSLLYQVVAHLSEPNMPPKQPKMPEAELALIKRWIELGAPETKAGAAKSAARKLDLDVSSVAMGKPEGPPPMPAQLPEVALRETQRPHPITAMAASPWAPLVAVAGHDAIRLYHTDTLAPLGALAFPERIPHVLKFSRNGKLLLAAGGRGAFAGRVVLFDITTGERVREIGDESDVVMAADISADHKLVALGGPSRLVKIYDAETGELRQKIKKHTDWVTSIEFSPDGALLASGDRAGGVYLWESLTGGILFTLADHRDSVTDMSWRADSKMLATSSEDGRVVLWLSEDGFPTRTINAHADGNRPASPRNRLPGVLSVQYAMNGTFATVGRDNSARLWKADGNPLKKLEGFPELPTRIVFSHDGERVFAGDLTGKVRVWSIKDAAEAGFLGDAPPTVP